MVNPDERIVQEVERLSLFELAGSLFGLDILKSREVFPLPRFTPLPNSGDIFCGVFNLRGEIFPLLDISPILGLPLKKVTQNDMVILVDNQDSFIFGMLVDKIHGILSYTEEEIQEPKGLVSKAMGAYVTGILHKDQNVIHTLDLEGLVRAKQILAHY